jgi:DnaK suppressor protein
MRKKVTAVKKVTTAKKTKTREQRLRSLIAKTTKEVTAKLTGDLKSAVDRIGKLSDVGDEADIAQDMNIDVLRENTTCGLRRQLLHLNEASKRLNAGKYGKCDVCKDEIPEERLEKMPLAIRCVTCQAEYERTKGHGHAVEIE